MSMRTSLPFVLLALCACQSTIAPAPVQSPTHGDQIAELRAQVAMLVSLATGDGKKVFDLTGDAPESAGMSELTARIATLNERLEALLARFPAAPPAGATADASSRTTGETIAAVDADFECCTALRQALLVLEQERRVIVENLANVQTPAYKRRALSITNELDPHTGVMLPKAGAIVPTMTSGALEITERNLDVAIDGEGFFAVVTPDGSTGYQRAGDFQINADGMIVSSSGCPVLPQITVPPDIIEISIAPDGVVGGRTAGSPDATTRFGQLTISRFVNTSGLRRDTGNMMHESDASGSPLSAAPGQHGLGLLKQGFLERSNVQTLGEMIDLQMVDRRIASIRRLLAGYGVFVR